MYWFFLFYFSLPSFMLPIGLGVTLYIRKQHTKYTHLLTLYITYIFIHELVTSIQAYLGIHNLYTEWFRVFFEILFYYLIFLGVLSKQIYKIIATSGFIVSFILYGIIFMNSNISGDSYPNFIRLISFSFNLLIVLCFYIDLFKNERIVSPKRDLHFILAAMLLLQNGLTLVMDLTYNFLIQSPIYSYLTYIITNTLVISFFVYNLIYTYLLWVNKRITT